MPRLILAMLAIALAAAGCSDSTGPNQAGYIEVVSGADQSGGQGAALAQPVVIRVVGHDGKAIGNARVTWRIIEGAGQILSADSLTDAQGQATAQWLLGFGMGQNLLLASVPGATVTIRATSQRQFTGVFAGGHHTCALTTLGEAFCWGANDRGQLGDGTLIGRAVPAPVRTTLRFRTLSLGWSFTCGISVDQDAYCWGDNSEGQLGSAGVPSWAAATPVAVLTPVTFSSIAAGYIHACGLAADGVAYCWGNNGRNQLGNAAPPSSNVPLRVSGAVRFRQISAGEFHSCGVSTDSLAFCWGWSSSGEVGSGAFGAQMATPAQVSGSVRFASISAGTRHTCALAVNGAAYCWGRSSDGEIGTPPFLNLNAPAQIPGSAVLQLVGTGNVSSCGVGSDAGGATSRFVFCWGSVGPRKMGSQPDKVFASPDLSLAVGFEHACTLQQSRIWCWGSNDAGQLGVTGISGSTDPVRVNFSNP